MRNFVVVRPQFLKLVFLKLSALLFRDVGKKSMLYVLHIIHNYEKRTYMFCVISHVMLIVSFAVATRLFSR